MRDLENNSPSQEDQARFPRVNPIWVWDLRSSAFVWANGPAIAFWDMPDLASLQRREDQYESPNILLLRDEWARLKIEQTANISLFFPHRNKDERYLLACRRAPLSGYKMAMVCEVLLDQVQEGFATAHRVINVPVLQATTSANGRYKKRAARATETKIHSGTGPGGQPSNGPHQQLAELAAIIKRSGEEKSEISLDEGGCSSDQSPPDPAPKTEGKASPIQPHDEKQNEKTVKLAAAKPSPVRYYEQGRNYEQGSGSTSTQSQSGTQQATTIDLDVLTLVHDHKELMDALDQVAEPVALTGVSRILHANSAFAQMFGYRDMADLNNDGLDWIFPGIREVLQRVLTGQDPERQRLLEGRMKSSRRMSLEIKMDVVQMKYFGTNFALLQIVDTPAQIVNKEDPLSDPCPDGNQLACHILDKLNHGFAIIDQGTNFTYQSPKLKQYLAHRGLQNKTKLSSLLNEIDRQKLEPLLTSKSDQTRWIKTKSDMFSDRACFIGFAPWGGNNDSSEQNHYWVLITSYLIEEDDTPISFKGGNIPALTAISHEVRTPLNAIIGFSEIMKDQRFGPIGNEQYLDYIGDIFASAHHALNLINDLLDLSKLKAGKWQADPENVDVNELVRKEIRMVRALAQQKNIVLRSDLEENLPLIFVDQRALTQILLNLLTNGIKYNKQGGQVRSRTEHIPDQEGKRGVVQLIVTDTGIGMNETDIVRAMRPFEQIGSPFGEEMKSTSDTMSTETTTGRQNDGQKGTGLGLPISKALADANDIDFAIESKIGEGTTVTLKFCQLKHT